MDKYKSRGFYSIKEDVKWLSSLLQEIGINKFILAGHSQGCLTALEFSKLNSNALKGIIFIAGAAQIPVNDFLLENHLVLNISSCSRVLRR